MKHVGIQVEAVGPDDRPRLRVYANKMKELGVEKGPSHRSPEGVAEIHHSLAVVIEAKADGVVLERLDIVIARREPIVSA